VFLPDPDPDPWLARAQSVVDQVFATDLPEEMALDQALADLRKVRYQAIDSGAVSGVIRQIDTLGMEMKARLAATRARAQDPWADDPHTSPTALAEPKAAA
jgi:hypothetical protein